MCNLKGVFFMKTNNINVKQVGNFVISYLSPREIGISWKGVLSSIATQMITHEKINGILVHTGTFCDLPFEGNLYPGINFRIPLFMSRSKLEKILIGIK